MNDLQVKTLHYLAEKGHPQRIEALTDLINRGIFNPIDALSETTKLLEAYLNLNPRNHCADGIERFRSAVGLVLKPRTVRVTLDVEVPGLKEGWQPSGGPAFTEGSGVAIGIQRLLLENECWPKTTLTGVKVIKTEGV